MDAPFDTSFMNYTVEQGYDEPFPTGTVQKTYTLGLQVWGWGQRYLQLDGVIGYDWIKNAANVPDIEKEAVWGRVTVSFRLEHLITID